MALEPMADATLFYVICTAAGYPDGAREAPSSRVCDCGKFRAAAIGAEEKPLMPFLGEKKT